MPDQDRFAEISSVEATVTRKAVGFLKGLLTLRRGQKRALVALIDATLCVAAVWIAFSLRLGTWVLVGKPVLITICIALALWAPIGALSGVYRAIFRYAGSGSIIGLVRACLIYMVPMVGVLMLVSIPGIPRTIGMIQPMVFLLLLVLSRVTARYLLVDILAQQTYRGVVRNVLIYGAGMAGRMLGQSVRHQPGMRVVGFVDDDERLKGQTLDGIKVYHAANLRSLLTRRSVSDVMLALPNISRSRRNEIIDRFDDFPVHVMTLPALSEIVEGRVSFDDLRELNIEDLLGRDPVPPNGLLMGKTVYGKTVLVTGAGGSIGSELCRQIIEFGPKELIIADMSEYSLYAIERELSNNAANVKIVPVLANLADAPLCDRLFAKHAPNTIFHAAAYKHVPLVEANVTQAISNNVASTLNCAEAAEKYGASHFVLISTDKAVRPTSVMGASKRICELVLQAISDRKRGKTIYAMVRFGNVLGSSGSVVPLFTKQIRKGGPITITDRNMTRYFMTIPEAAQLVIQAGAMAKGGEVYVLDMGEAVEIYDLARTMVHLSGLTVKDARNPDGDIVIEEVGLRPGEKLYEELLIGDNPSSTRHERIMTANENFFSWDVLQPQIQQLQRATSDHDEYRALAIVRQLVPEYSNVMGETQSVA